MSKFSKIQTPALCDLPLPSPTSNAQKLPKDLPFPLPLHPTGAPTHTRPRPPATASPHLPREAVHIPVGIEVRIEIRGGVGVRARHDGGPVTATTATHHWWSTAHAEIHGLIAKYLTVTVGARVGVGGPAGGEWRWWRWASSSPVVHPPADAPPSSIPPPERT